MLNYNCIIKEDHLDIRKTSEDVKLPLSKEDRNTLLDMYEYVPEILPIPQTLKVHFVLFQN
jgi:hypothetical protein